MTYAALIMLVGAVGATSIILDRRWQARKLAADTPAAAEPTPPAPESAADAPVTSWLARVTGRVTTTLSTLPLVGDLLTRSKEADLPSQFQAWIASADEPSIHAWVQGLSKEGLQAFTEHVSAFCAEMGFELAWVVQQQLVTHPELAQAFTQVVLHYCRACHAAAVAQDELEGYKTLQAFERNPSSRKTQAFGHKLFAKVVEAGLTSVSMSEYLMATPKEQQQYMVRAIREAAQAHSAAFNRVLKEVARGPQSAAAQPAATPESTVGGQDAAAPAATPA